MACFLVPATEAVITTTVTKVLEKKAEKKGETCEVKAPEGTFVSKLKWLNQMLAGGSALLAFEHIWHGEIVPYFPFLTAAGNKADLLAMLHEMATTGVGMAALVTIVWAGAALFSHSRESYAKENRVADPVQVRSRMAEEKLRSAGK